MERSIISDEYAAASIEARGQVQTNIGGVGRSRPQMRVTALDPAVPDALAEYFGLGKKDTFHPRTAPHLTLYGWQVRGKAAAEVLERAAPYMVSDIRRDVEYILERVMNLGENRIEMRIPRSPWFPCDLRFPHS